jgi:hypothetical protein
MKGYKLFTAALLLVAGCSAFPGLRVLTGEDTGTGAGPIDVNNADVSDLVMADKTGATDPSLMAAANRIEAAALNLDIIEIRKDETNNTFVVNSLFMFPQDADLNTQAGLITLYTAFQRAMEVTWQGTLAESEGTGALQVNLISPRGIATLDSGTSFVGFVDVNSEIERGDAIKYLSGARGLNDFVDLIVNGTLLFESPQETVLFNGEPNHPLFMLDRIQVAAGS